MLITHDMGVIAETADRVAVMYAGRIAEIGPVRDVVQRAAAPLHRGPDGLDPDARRARPDRLVQIPGSMPRLTAIPTRLRLPSALRLRLRPLPAANGRSRACGERAGACCLHEVGVLASPATRRPSQLEAASVTAHAGSQS